MLSDQDIISELNKGATAAATGLVIAPFPREGRIDWSTLPLSDPQWSALDSPIQPASVDLHVGHIFVPETREESIGGANHGSMSHTIKPGHSVVVSTYERISLPASLGGIVFPPSKLSSSGILVSNIGHIDPGFSGHLRFTLINMGGRDFPLERGTVAVGTLLLFKLATAAAAPWLSRHNATEPKGEPDKAEIDALAKDFADIESRIARITRATAWRMQWRFGVLSVLIPAILGIGLAVWAVWFETGRSLSDRIDKNQQAMSEMELSLAKLNATGGSHVEVLEHEFVRAQVELEVVEQNVSELRERAESRRRGTGQQ